MAFFPFNPTRLRRRLVWGAVAAAVIAVWAMVGWSRGTERFAAARALAGVALGGAMGSLWWRLRPRPGYGVRVDRGAVVFARPLAGEVAVPTSELAAVERSPQQLTLTLRGGDRLLLPRALFDSPEAFAGVGSALEEVAPPPSHQA